MHYFFFETCQQFIFALEIAKQKKLENYHLINLTFNKTDKTRIIQVQREQKIKIIDFTVGIKKLNSTKKLFIDLYKLLILKFYSLKIKNIDHIYIAGFLKPYFWPLLNSCKCKIQLYDDGILTINSESTFSKPIELSLKPFRAAFKYFKFLFPDKLELKRYTFISFFNVQGKNIEVLSYSNNSTSIKQKLIDEVWFIGQPLIEMGYTTKDLFERKIQDLKFKFPNFKIVYFPHPKEVNAEKYYSGSIRYINKPFELYLLEQEEIPRVIISYYSTSVILAKTFFNQQAIKYLYIRLKNERNNLKLLYEVAESRYNIEITDE